jgi:site-specific DNA-methyltransferase (adenine-specific)
MITATNEDNMIMMARYPDDYFDLAIVDPPYGIDIHKMSYTQSTKGGVAKRKDYSSVGDWDSNNPDNKYYSELFRTSKNQIIWGGNYFNLPLTKSWLIWDKRTEAKYSNDFADCEMAWNSFNKPAKIFRWLWSGMMQHDMKNKEVRIHPTQKPVKLYEWLLMNYAKEGDKIVDTHRGSASLDIACHNLGFDLVTCELDTDYFNDGNKRLKQHQKQQVIKF